MRIKKTIIVYFILFIFSALAASASDTKKLWSVKDENKDGAPDVWFYKIDKNTVSMEQDFDFNGSPDTCEFRTKEEKSKTLKTDFGCDGSIDVWTNETEQEKWVKIDFNSDNLFDMSAYFKNGKKVKL